MFITPGTMQLLDSLQEGAHKSWLRLPVGCSAQYMCCYPAPAAEFLLLENLICG